MNPSSRFLLLTTILCFCLLMFPGYCMAQNNENIDFPSYGNDEYSDEGYYETESTNANDYYEEDESTSTYSEYEEEDGYEYDYADEYSEEPVAVEQPVIEPARPVIPAGKPIKLEEKTIRIGRIPYMSIKEMMAHMVPLLGVLKKKTGAKEVRLVSSGKDYSSILKALARGNIDFAWVGPTAYLKFRDKDHLMAVAKAKFGNETAYRGVFIAPAKGKVQGLEDLSGSRIGLVDPQSASGYIYPMYLLKSLKIKLGKNTRIRFLKNHNNVLLAVLKGVVDAGVCLEETIKTSKFANLDKKIIVLAKTPEIPSDVLVCRQDCPINLREKFQSALTEIKPGELRGSSMTFLPATDDEFASVEFIMRSMGLLD